MINPVSNFFPAVIRNSLPPVQQNVVAQQSAVFKAANDNSGQLATGNSSQFSDKLTNFFSLSPSDFSDVFGSLGSAGFSTAPFPQTASAAYTQSSLLTANKLSITA